MSRNFRILLIVLSSATILVVVTVLSPRLLSMYYQMRAAELVNDAARNAQVGSELDLFCKKVAGDQQEHQAALIDAVDKLNSSILYDKKNSQAYLYLGRAYCLLGDHDQAIGNYQIFVNLKPNNPLGYLGLGFAYEAAGDFSSAVVAWKQAGSTGQDFVNTGYQYLDEGKLNDAQVWFNRALLIDPESATAWIGLGKVNEEKRSVNKAVEAYEIAWKLSPQASTTDYLRVLKRIGAQRKIVDMLRSSLGEVPHSPDRLMWYRELGSVLSSQGKWNEAESILKDAALEFPNEPDTHIDLGWIQYKRGDGLEKAKEEFEQATRLAENKGDGYFAIAQLYNREKKFREAEKYYSLALEKAPNRWFYTAQADNSRQAGDLTTAIERYRQVISLYPDFSPPYFQLALAYRLNGEEKEAITAIEKAVELMNPPQDTYYARAGDIYHWAGLDEKAIEAYSQALEINPNNPSVLRNLDLINQN